MLRKTAQGLTAVEWNQKALALVVGGKCKDPERALDYLNKAIHIDPKYAFAYNNRGLAYRDLGKHHRAIEDFNQAIRLDTRDASFYNGRGLAYAGLGLYQRAIEDHNQAIRIDPKYATAYNSRGLAYGMLGDNAKGCEDLRKACELGDCKLLNLAKKEGSCR
jgi:tetratricopeptide (TPR) repeat protein